jgi:hypothetical protein
LVREETIVRLAPGHLEITKIQTNQKETHPMKPIKKTIASLALAVMLLPTILVTPVQAEGPVEAYLSCAAGCVDNYAPWTLRRAACAVDCYIKFVGDIYKAILG